jgi:PRC-barrel domain
MRRILIAAIFSVAAGAAAYAQAPAPRPDASAEHPPTNRMDQAVPTMKAPGGQELPPTNRMDEAVPPMKSTDAQSTGPSTQTGSLVPDQQWIGRSVYSSDGKELGKVAAVTKADSQSEITVDMGGFLGLGAKPTLIKPDQIQEATDERIVLTLTEAEAESLPAAEDDEQPAQQ